MKKIGMILTVLVLLIGCRQKSDNVLNYAFNDNMAFQSAEKSFAAKFDVIWNGMNANYALWDLEYAYGFNWDAVYDTYRPQFEALDQQKTAVTDEQVQALLDSMVAPFHDGHLTFLVKNHVTGHELKSSPNKLRVLRERGEEYNAVSQFIPSLSYYAALPGELLEYQHASSLVYDSTLQGVDTTKLIDNAITIQYGLFKDNIAYLQFDAFYLSPYLHPDFTQMIFGTPSAGTKAVIDSVAGTWRAWFNAIQQHHKAGDLGGVIIDIRSNGGGYMADYKYVLGALLPEGGYHNCNARFKRGTGRLDYSPVMPQYVQTLSEDHVTVTKPIVVLCNCASVSMAEQTSLGAKSIENATLIGTRTWGGLCALDEAASYSDNYSGYVGVRGVTPVFCYIPREVVFTLDGEVLESVGITPDIELPFDSVIWNKGAGPDNQIDRALQLIRTGN